MNWLSYHRAVIDCYRRRVTICTPKGDCFSFTGDRSIIVDPYISDRCDRDSLTCLLASLTLEEGKVVQQRLPPVISEFPNIFPDELPGLCPVREVEFTIELQSRTAPISMAPYHFAPAELVELKKKL